MSLPHTQIIGQKNNVALLRLTENLATIEARVRAGKSPGDLADDVHSLRTHLLAGKPGEAPSPYKLSKTKAALGPYVGLRRDLASMLRELATTVDRNGGFEGSFKIKGGLYDSSFVIEACFKLADELDA